MECKALPSEVAAVNVFRGEKHAVSEAVHYTAWRALAIGLQLHALGVKPEDLFKYSALASLGVELNVLSWAYETNKKYPGLTFDKDDNPSTCIPFGPERAASNLGQRLLDRLLPNRISHVHPLPLHSWRPLCSWRKGEPS